MNYYNEFHPQTAQWLRELIAAYAERLKVEAHTLGDHGLSEAEFYHI